MIDWEHAERLLHIVDKARQWPNLKWLHDAAMKELENGAPKTVKPLEKLPPIERSMRGATSSTYFEQGKEETK